jgi:hypothetical protein
MLSPLFSSPSLITACGGKAAACGTAEGRAARPAWLPRSACISTAAPRSALDRDRRSTRAGTAEPTPSGHNLLCPVDHSEATGDQGGGRTGAARITLRYRRGLARDVNGWGAKATEAERKETQRPRRARRLLARLPR